jgi:hypothetical protein
VKFPCCVFLFIKFSDFAHHKNNKLMLLHWNILQDEKRREE